MHAGRNVIYTDVPEITRENVISVLREAVIEHELNSQMTQYLIDYDAGNQPLQRVKKTRTDIDIHCIDNVANEITEFWCGFAFGNPITLVQRGKEKESIARAVSMLNDCYETENVKAKTQELGRYLEICGVGYVYVDVNMDWKDGDSYFTLDVLDPRTSFVVRSNYYPDHRVMLGVTYRQNKRTKEKHFTCFSKNMRFEILDQSEILNGETVTSKWGHKERSGEENPLGCIPIVEYIRSYDRTGVFERQISELDNINLMISDFSNDVDQNTQVIWHGNDVVFPTENVEDADGNMVEVVKKPVANEWVLTYTPDSGKSPTINPLTVDYDYSGMLNNIVTRRSLVLQKCNVPQRNDNSGGSTGIAMSDATGWSSAENAAAKQQMIIDSCKMEEVKVVLAAIAISPDVETGNPLLNLKASDMQPNVKRQKTYEMTTKANAIATLLSHGIYGEDVLNTISFFDDPNEVWQRSKALIEKYQSSIFDKSTNNEAVGGSDEKSPNADRTMQDLSDQIDNSPVIDKSRTDK